MILTGFLRHGSADHVVESVMINAPITLPKAAAKIAPGIVVTVSQRGQIFELICLSHLLPPMFQHRARTLVWQSAPRRETRRGGS